MKRIVLSAVLLLNIIMPFALEAKTALTDMQIKKILIKESIDSYYGSCPCPYNAARNGSSCGRRSAYSRPGGAAPLCYPRDVSAEDIKTYKEFHQGK